MQKKRYNIGLAVACINDPFSFQITKGALAAAKEQDVNLFIFPGKYVGLSRDFYNEDSKYEYQYNALFYHAAAAKLDYLIVATGTIGYAMTDEEKKEFLHIFDGTPVLSIASDIEDYNYMNFDNRTGIVEAVTHLVKECGRRNIGMIIGNTNNFECAERFDSYREALAINGLTFNPNYCTESDLGFLDEDKIEALLRENSEIDAMICVNDMLAKQLYAILKKMGRKIGNDIAVVGFDDQPFASTLEPPLSSIRADAVELGRVSLEKAVHVLKGIKDKTDSYPTRFIARQSTRGQNKLSISDFDLCKFTVSESVDRIMSRLNQNMTIQEKELIQEFCHHLLNRIQKRLIYSSASENDLDTLITLCDSFFNNDISIESHILDIQRIAEIIYQSALLNAPDENKAYVQKFYNYFNKRLSLDLIYDYQVMVEKNTRNMHINNLLVLGTLSLSGNLHDNYPRMLKQLTYLNVPNSHAYLLDEPVVYHWGDIFDSDTEWYDQGGFYHDSFVVPAENEKICTLHQALINPYTNDEDQHSFVVVDLFSAEYQYGFVLCEVTSPTIIDSYELVTFQLSSSARTLGFLKNQEIIMQKLYNANLVLNSMSCTDELTKLKNRRGFFEDADELLKKGGSVSNEYILAYADMDRLKAVNDTYGHSEGDFALRSLADCLKTMFGPDAIVARFGGDEYAAMCRSDLCQSINNIRKIKTAFLHNLNENAGKPYLIDMSLGIVKCTCANMYDLKAALDQADSILYEEKKKKKESDAVN